MQLIDNKVKIWYDSIENLFVSEEVTGIKIAVCDDEPQVLLSVLSQLASYQEQRKAELSSQIFESAIDLLQSMEHENYDLLLLDVQMPGLNGIEAAREIRQKNEQIKIVFLTSSPEYAVESYSVQATNYLLKPATKDRLFPILDQIFDLLRKPEAALTVQTGGSVFRLPYGKIEYMEVISKTIYFHLADGSIKQTHGSLSAYESILLSHPGFCKVHRSYLVNLSWVTEVRQGALLTVSGKYVPIARSLYQQVRTAYTEFLFEDSNMAVGSGGAKSCNN